MSSPTAIGLSTTVADILCDQCQTPLIEIDLYGERLSGTATNLIILSHLMRTAACDGCPEEWDVVAPGSGAIGGNSFGTW